MHAKGDLPQFGPSRGNGLQWSANARLTFVIALLSTLRTAPFISRLLEPLDTIVRTYVNNPSSVCGRCSPQRSASDGSAEAIRVSLKQLLLLTLALKWELLQFQVSSPGQLVAATACGPSRSSKMFCIRRCSCCPCSLSSQHCGSWAA